MTANPGHPTLDRAVGRLVDRLYELERRLLQLEGERASSAADGVPSVPPVLDLPDSGGGGALLWCACESSYEVFGGWTDVTVLSKTFTLDADARVQLAASWTWQWDPSAGPANYRARIMLGSECQAETRLRGTPSALAPPARSPGALVVVVDLTAGTHTANVVMDDLGSAGFFAEAVSLSILAGEAGDESACSACCMPGC